MCLESPLTEKNPQKNCKSRVKSEDSDSVLSESVWTTLRRSTVKPSKNLGLSERGISAICVSVQSGCARKTLWQKKHCKSEDSDSVLSEIVWTTLKWSTVKQQRTLNSHSGESRTLKPEVKDIVNVQKKMNTFQLRFLLEKIQETSSAFGGVYPIDKLPRNPRKKEYIVNLDPHDQPGSHWVGVWVEKDGKCEIMDSYGRRLNNLNLTRFGKLKCRQMEYNTKVLQGPYTNVCGQNCMLFIHLKSTDLRMIDFTNVFTKDKNFNDILYVE